MDNKSQKNNNIQLKKEMVRGFWVKFDPKLGSGVNYLRNHLDQNEIKPFFAEAKKRGKADFEDRQGLNWRLIYAPQDGSYTLMRR